MSDALTKARFVLLKVEVDQLGKDSCVASGTKQHKKILYFDFSSSIYVTISQLYVLFVSIKSSNNTDEKLTMREKRLLLNPRFAIIEKFLMHTVIRPNKQKKKRKLGGCCCLPVQNKNQEKNHNPFAVRLYCLLLFLVQFCWANVGENVIWKSAEKWIKKTNRFLCHRHASINQFSSIGS